MNKLALIVPDIFTVANKFQPIRKNMIDRYDISVVSLSQKTFHPFTNSKSSLIFLSKPKKTNFLKFSDDYEKLEWKQVNYGELEKNNWVFRNLNKLAGKLKLGEILEQVYPTKAKIEPKQKYYELTVRTKGRGIERRIRNKFDFIWGWQINSNRYLAPAGCLIISKIDARNGAIGIIPPSLGNSLITNTFLLFKLKELQAINLPCLVEVLNSSTYLDYFESLSCGTTNRRSLSTDDFLNTSIQVEKFTELLPKYQRKKELENELILINQQITELFLENE